MKIVPGKKGDRCLVEVGLNPAGQPLLCNRPAVVKVVEDHKANRAFCTSHFKQFQSTYDKKA